MKKLLAVLVLCVILLTGTISFAAGVGDWTNLGGFVVDGKQLPAQIKQTADGIQVYQEKGLWTSDGKDSGIRYNKKVDLEGFSIQLNLDDKTGLLGMTDPSSYLVIQLNNTEKYFSALDPAASCGILAAFQVTADGIVYGVLFESKTVAVIGTPIQITGDKIKLSCVKDTDGTYAVSINDNKAGNINLSDLMSDGKAHLIVGASTISGQPVQFTVNKLNGKSLGSIASSSSNPETGDMGTVLYVMTAVVAGGAGFVAYKKRK